MPLNRPNKIELLDAVAEFQQQLVEHCDDLSFTSKLKFHARVSQHVMNILKRELMQADQLTSMESDLLSQHVSTQHDSPLNAAIIDAIDAGEFDAEDKRKQLLDDLMQIALSKLAIDNPKYPTYLNLVERV